MLDNVCDKLYNRMLKGSVRMIAIGCDHGGFALKQVIMKHLDEIGREYIDLGTYDEQSVDYPDIAKKVCAELTSGTAKEGILICGTGIGMNICANKIKGIRAAQCSDTYSAKMTRRHNDSNVLTMGGRIIGPELAIEITDAFLTNKFEGGRHQRRVDKINELEK